MPIFIASTGSGVSYNVCCNVDCEGVKVRAGNRYVECMLNFPVGNWSLHPIKLVNVCFYLMMLKKTCWHLTLKTTVALNVRQKTFKINLLFITNYCSFSYNKMRPVLGKLLPKHVTDTFIDF